MGYFWLILDMLKIALDYLENETGVTPDEVSASEIEQGFGTVWGVELWSTVGHSIAFISDSGHVGTYEVYHMHWFSSCAVCGSAALWRCTGCNGFFCGTHYETHLQDNAPYLKGDSNV